MEQLIASLESVESLLNSVEEQLGALKLEEANEVLRSGVQLAQRRHNLMASLSKKNAALFRELLRTHYRLTCLVGELTAGRASIRVGGYEIRHLGDPHGACHCHGGRRIEINGLMFWSKNLSLFWELTRALSTEIEKFLRLIATDTSLKEKVAESEELTKFVGNLAPLIQEASNPPG